MDRIIFGLQLGGGGMWSTEFHSSLLFGNKLCGRPPQYAPPLQVDLLTLKVVSKSRVTWATSVPILVFLASLSVLDLGPMYDRQTDVRCTSSLNGSTLWGRGHNNRGRGFAQTLESLEKPLNLKLEIPRLDKS